MAEDSERPEDLSRTLLGGQEFYFEFYCFPCHEDGRHVEAVGYCKDCNDYLCDECYRSHCRPKQLRHHVLLDSKHMPKDVTSSRRVVQTDRCTDTCNKHPDRVIEYYCHTHDVLACTACAFADHRTCDKVDLIADVADKIDGKNELKDTQEQLQKLAENARQHIQTSQDSISLSNKCAKTALQSMRTYIHETISSLEKVKKELETEAKEFDSKNEMKLKSALSESDSVLVEIKGTLQSISTLEQNKQFCNLFVAVKKAQKILPTMTKTLDRTRQDNMIDEFKFEPNLKLQRMLRHKAGVGNIIEAPAPSEERVTTFELLARVSDPDSKPTTTNTSEITSDELEHVTSIDQHSHQDDTKCDPDLGQRKTPKQSGSSSLIPTDGITAESAKRTSKPRTSSGNNSNSTVHVQHKDINARHITDIKVKSKSDSKTCYITGVVILPEEKMVAIDRDNSKVKVIDINKQIMISEFKLESEPWDVTSVDRDTIVVTLPYVRKLQYLNVSADGTVSKSRTVKVNGYCHGIAFARDKLWVSYTSPGKLVALTLGGEVLLCTSTDESGQDIFLCPNYVALSPDVETVYVSDALNKTVYRLSSTGKLLSDCKLEVPTGVAVAADGTVYTCSGGEVYMLTAACEKIKTLLGGGQAGGPVWGFAYDEDTRRLVVGTHDSNVVKIVYLTGF